MTEEQKREAALHTWTGSKFWDGVIVVLAFAFFGGFLLVGAR